ncbi:hypothetical protein ACHAPF_010545 [Botrytis cinerea]
MASGSKKRVIVSQKPDSVDKPYANNFDADHKDSSTGRRPPRRRHVNDIILERYEDRRRYQVRQKRYVNDIILESYEGRRHDQKRQREVITVVNAPPISGLMTNLQVSLDCIDGYFEHCRQMNSHTELTMIASEHVGRPTVYISGTSNRSSSNLRNTLITCLGPHSPAFPVQPNSEFYQPLDRSTDQMRLLERVAVRPESTSCCNLPVFKLVVKSLSDLVEYSALSYAWGEDSSLECIVINGSRVEVRANLANILVHICPTTSFLWIDALCINQDDVNERNHQVMQMSSIYKQAREVIVWLGDNTYQGFGKNAETLIPDIGLSSMKRLAALHKDLACKPSGTDVTVKTDELRLGAELVSLGELCSRPYWNRLWIVQEVLLAKDLIICWSNKHSPGLRTVAWADWSRARHTLENLKSSIGPSWDRELKMKAIETILESAPANFDRLRETGNQNWPLNSLLEMFASSECQVQADKIYGLLGIVSDTELCNFPVDYARPLFDTYVEILNCYAQTRSRGSPALDVVRLSQSLQLAWNGLIPTPGMALEWCEVEKMNQTEFFHCRGYMEGFVVASNITKDDLPQRLKVELPEIKSTWKILSSKIRGLDSCSKKHLKGFDSKFSYATRENLPQCNVGESVTKETLDRSNKVHETGFFISSTGDFGIASAEVRKDDFICCLKDADTTLIIRQRRDHYPLVSRAVMTSYADNILKFGGHAKNTKHDALNLFLDLLTLQAVTYPIKLKEGIPYWESLTMKDAISKLRVLDTSNMYNSQRPRGEPIVNTKINSKKSTLVIHYG